MADIHDNFMKIALQEAKKAGQIGEVPIGAILVANSGEVLSAAHNRTIKQVDPTAHAEILALRKMAEDTLGDDFDIREFHDRILENGTIPLLQLRAHIEAWINDYGKQP